jgi:hypothetical protein
MFLKDKEMKKFMGFFAAIMLISTLIITEAIAQPSGKGKMGANKSGSRFVDSNGDGVCDLNTSGTAGAGMRNQGKTRINFVDADGDGVCDLNTSGTTGAGMRNHGKIKPNFIDADGDGVCDNLPTSPSVQSK